MSPTRQRSPSRRSATRNRSDEPSIYSLLNQASRDTTADLRRVVKAEGIPVEFWRALELLADERGRSVSELARALAMAMPATSKLVDRMTEAALIQRAVDPTDQRRVIIFISDFGLIKVTSLRSKVAKYRNTVEGEFSKIELDNLRELLVKLIAARDQATESR